MLNFLINIAQAQSLDNSPGIDLTIEGLKEIIVGLACWFSSVALILIVIAVIFYGAMFLVSRGDPTKVGNARKALTWGIVGIIVILGTYTIIGSVQYAVTGSEDFEFVLQCL